MKRQWSERELGAQWSISHDEYELLKHRTGRSRVGFIALLKFFSIEGRFPQDRREVPLAAIEYLAEQVDVKTEAFANYELNGRSYERDRSQIRSLLGFRPATVDDVAQLVDWLRSEVLPFDHKPDHVQDFWLVSVSRFPSLVEKLVRASVAWINPQMVHNVRHSTAWLRTEPSLPRFS